MIKPITRADWVRAEHAANDENNGGPCAPWIVASYLPDCADLDALRAENEKLRDYAKAVGLRQGQMYRALVAAKLAINPSDRAGISLHEWNKRLKEVTKVIDAALAGQQGERDCDVCGGDCSATPAPVLHCGQQGERDG